jgi:hypothetical protein
MGMDTVRQLSGEPDRAARTALPVALVAGALLGSLTLLFPALARPFTGALAGWVAGTRLTAALAGHGLEVIATGALAAMTGVLAILLWRVVFDGPRPRSRRPRPIGRVPVLARRWSWRALPAAPPPRRAPWARPARSADRE